MKEEKDNTFEQDREDLQKILSTKEGKRFIWRLFEHTGLFRNPCAFESNTTAYNCGKQSVGQYILDEALEANPKVCSEIIINNKKEEDAGKQRDTK